MRIHIAFVFGLLIKCQAIGKTLEAGCSVDTYAHAPSFPHKILTDPPPCLSGAEESFDQSKLWTTLRWYPNSNDFMAYRGYDFYPERFNEYNPTYQNFFSLSKAHTGPAFQNKPVRLMTCESKGADNSKWSVQKVGPFISTGGYDWWQLSWIDAGRFAQVFKKHPLGVSVLETSIRPVNASGAPLGFPPIHIHHVHLNREGRNPKFRNDYTDDGTALYHEWFYEAHGDYQCRDQDGGMRCFVDGIEGYGKVLDYPLHIEGEFNDVRALGSPPMEWWIEVSFRWVPVSPESSRNPRTESVHDFGTRGTTDYNSQQSLVGTFDLKTDGEPYMTWYSGHMNVSGDMMKNKIHAHSRGFESGMFFAGTPEDLGLQYSRFLPEIVPQGSGHANHITSVKAAGFESQAQLRDYIFRSYGEAVRTYDAVCTGSNSDPRCRRPRPALICEGWTDKVEVQGMLFDRRPPTCCKDWSFKKGDPYIAVGFYAWDGFPSGPIGATTFPSTYPQHLAWFMRYASHDGRSTISASLVGGTIGYAAGQDDEVWSGTKSQCIQNSESRFKGAMLLAAKQMCVMTNHNQLFSDPSLTGSQLALTRREEVATMKLLSAVQAYYQPNRDNKHSPPHRQFLPLSQTNAELLQGSMESHANILSLFTFAAMVCMCSYLREKQRRKEDPCIKLPQSFQWTYRSVYVQAGVGENSRKETSYQTCKEV